LFVQQETNIRILLAQVFRHLLSLVSSRWNLSIRRSHGER
jgi:hypothetical protein